MSKQGVYKGEISGSHGSKYESSHLQGVHNTYLPITSWDGVPSLCVDGCRFESYLSQIFVIAFS
jgi:hypothetical protein